MARDILYEHVIFHNSFSLIRSLAALSESGSDSLSFHSTKSLVLDFFAWHQCYNSVVKILKLCKNLRTLDLRYFSPRLYFNHNQMKLVINAIPSNLVALAYHGEFDESIMKTLNPFQKLEFLFLLPFLRSRSIGRDLSTFPHVRYITLPPDYAQRWSSYCPDARDISIIITWDVHLRSPTAFQNNNPTAQSKVEHLNIATKTWFSRYTKFGDVISASFMQGFQNLIILSYNPFVLCVSQSHPFETHPTLQSVRHYITIPEVNHEGKGVDKALQVGFKASWVRSWNWLHDGEDKFPRLKSIVGVYDCKEANEIEEDLLRYVDMLGGYDPKLSFACMLQCQEIRIH